MNNIKKNWDILLFSFLTLGLFLVWYVLFAQDPEGNQTGVFFSNATDWFMDYFNTVYMTVGKSPYTWGYLPARNYLPIAYLILYPASFLFEYDVEDIYTSYDARYFPLPSIIFLVIVIFWVGLLFYVLYRASKRTESGKLLLLLSVFFSCIMLLNLDRCNEIILTAALSFVFLLKYDAKSAAQRHFALIALGFAATLKIVPAILGIVLIYKKQFKDLVFLVLYTLLLAILPFFWLEGDIGSNINALLSNLSLHAEAYKDGNLGLTAATIFPGLHLSAGWLNYLLVAVAALGAWKLHEVWQKQLLLLLAVVLSTGQQGDYSLILLLLPFITFFNAPVSLKRVGWILLFVLLLCPVQYDWTLGVFRMTNLLVTNTACILTALYLAGKGIVTIFTDKKHSILSA
ncbi:MAG: glycosyltransferase 87 family protein [Clostridiales bacterium]|nr:glycosyltransferase 87 family protein [Clostridiales bacterium]